MRGTTTRYLVAVVAAAAFVWLLGPGWIEGFPAAFPDSASYLAAADAGPLSTELWFGHRPPTYPLLLWVVGPSTRAIVAVQTLAAGGAWVLLGTTVWHELRSRAVAGATIAMLALVAIQSRWAFWHGAILTESLSTTLAVVGIATWWRWCSRPDRFRLTVAVLATAVWMLLRDANAVSFAVVAVPGLVAAMLLARRGTGPCRRGTPVALAVLVAVAAFSLIGQVASNRGETSFHNNVGLRWLVDDDMRSWMVARGLPESAALTDRAGQDAWADGEAFLRSPDLAEYREWADGRGRIVAAASFVVRADWYLARWWRDLPVHAGSDHLAYDTHGLAARLPERPLGPVDPVASRVAVVVWALGTAAAAVVVAVRRPRLGWLIPFWFVPVVVDLYLVYAADAVEVGRHLVGPMARFAVVAVVAVALGADALVPDTEADDGRA